MELVSIGEVVAFLKIKKTTIYSWVHRGKIPSHKLNGLVRFDMEEIREWVKQSKIEPLKAFKKCRKTVDSDFDSVLKKAVDSIKSKEYNPSKRETSLNQGLRKEVP